MESSLKREQQGGGFNRLPAKQAGLVLPDPKKTAHEKWTAYFIITVHIVAVLRGQEELQTADISAYLWEGGAEVRKRSVLWAYEDLTETLTGEAAQDALRLRKATQKGAWMTVQPSTVIGTELGALE